MAAVVFDVGDTLAASQYLLDRHVDSVFTEGSKDMFPAEFPQTVYNIWRTEDVTQLFREYGLDTDDLRIDYLMDTLDRDRVDEQTARVLAQDSADVKLSEAARLVVDSYRAREEQFLRDTGVFELLDRVKQEYGEVGILTNNSYEGGEIYREMFNRHCNTDLDVLVSSDHYRVRTSKPDWRIFDRAIRALDADPADTVYIGNKEAGDLRGAYRAGLQPIGAVFYKHDITTRQYPVIGHELEPGDIEAMHWRDYDIVDSIQTVLSR